MSFVGRVVNKLSALRIYKETSRWVSKEPVDLVSFGTDYGGWTVPAKCVRPGAIAICAGAGEDLSFDVELNRRGMNVYVVDPTPRAKAHYDKLEKALLDPESASKGQVPYDLKGLDLDRLHFVEKGLWSREGNLKFFSPKNEAFVSHSVKNFDKTAKFFEACCTTPKLLCEHLNVPMPEIFKMDIEGAEHEVIDSICDDDFLPDVLCVEFDEARAQRDESAIARLNDSIVRLRAKGYRLVNIAKYWEFTFTRV